jgi:hypothetical protein
MLQARTVWIRAGRGGLSPYKDQERQFRPPPSLSPVGRQVGQPAGSVSPWFQHSLTRGPPLSPRGGFAQVPCFQRSGRGGSRQISDLAEFMSNDPGNTGFSCVAAREAVHRLSIRFWLQHASDGAVAAWRLTMRRPEASLGQSASGSLPDGSASEWRGNDQVLQPCSAATTPIASYSV